MLDPGQAEPMPITSTFAADVRNRTASIHRRHAWKSEGRGARFQRGLSWGVDAEAGQPHAVAMTSVRAGQGGTLLYTLQSGPVSGVFRYRLDRHDPSGADHTAETRLFHTADMHVDGLSDAQHDYHLCAVRSGGLSAIAAMEEDGSELMELTSGDSFDDMPSWVPGRDRVVVFQSAGVARNPQGYMVGLGPSEVQTLDVPDGRLETLLSDPKHDLLAPRITADGTLYCIRRPHDPPAASGSPLRAVTDVLLFPVRLVLALLHWLNYFTTSMTGKPLTTAGGPAKQGADVRRMMVLGNLVEAERDGLSLDGDPASVVPANWQLVRRDADGKLTTLAKGVVAYDLLPDGGVLYSNGNVIYRLGPDGKRTRVLEAEAITHVCHLPA